ncbi:MAG TPA: hypothetical protein VD738_05490, partial [Nitrospira sp.]|nr:hypothetical protein [Nitrospira sp.]
SSPSRSSERVHGEGGRRGPGRSVGCENGADILSRTLHRGPPSLQLPSASLRSLRWDSLQP